MVTGIFLSDDDHLLRLNDAYDCSYIIHFNQNIIGTLKYREHNNQSEIMQLQIHPDYQGQGLGKQIMLQVMKQTKLKAVKLSVLKNNPALKLYQSLGFTIIDEDEHEFYMKFSSY